MNDFSLQVLRNQQFFQISLFPYNKNNEFLFINNENYQNVIASYHDHAILYEYPNKRGAEPGEIFNATMSLIERAG